MHCEQAREFLESLAAGRLEPKQAAEVQAHVKGCAACGRELQWIEALKTSVRSVPRPAMPADLRADLLRLAGQPRGWRSWFGERFSWQMTAGVGFAFAAAAAFLVFRNSLSGPREEIALSDVLAAHNRYELTMPAADREAIYSDLSKQLAQGGPSDEN